MKSSTKARAGIIATALAFFLLIQLLSRFPAFVDTYYSNGVYKYLNILVSNFSRQFRFSLSEFCLWFVLLIGVPAYIGRIRKRRRRIGRLLLNLVTVLSILVMWFYIFWGINYFRLPLKEKLGLASIELSESALDTTFTDIIHNVNRLNRSYTIESVEQINTIIDSAYQTVLQDSILAAFQPPKTIKTFAANWILNKTTTSGFFSPFFHEVHYNSDLLVFELPFVLAHEKAHIIGFTSEAEANFLAFLVCSHANSDLARYSAQFYVLGYFFNTVRNDSTKYRGYVNLLSDGVKMDLTAVRERWRSHRGRVSAFSNKSYDLYLKANKVKAGIADYARVVDLIVRYYARNAL